MRFVSQFRQAAAVALAFTVSGCNLDVPGPPVGTPIEIKLDFCANDTPIWFVFADGSNAFQVVTPNAAGTFTFMASSRVTVAYVRQRGNDFRTDILFTTNEALVPFNTLTCLEQGGTRQVNGTVTGHSGAQLGLVSLSTSSAFVPADQSAWSLTQLVSRPLDLIASRIDVSNGNQHTNKTIIRRAQNPANGATLAALAFDSEGFAPVQNTVNVSGIGTLDHAVVFNAFFSSLGTSHTVTFADSVADGPTAIETIPADEAMTTEYHKVSAIATSPTGGVRVAERYFRDPGTQGLTVGPSLIDPSVEVIGTTPYVTLRTQIDGQIDYSTMINMAFHQQTPTQAIDVSMSVTASYFSGTPSEWILPMPNFSGLQGWQNAWGLKTGSIGWEVTGYFGRPQLILGAPPNAVAGETVNFGRRSSTITATSIQASQAASVRAASMPATLPGHFGPLGPARSR